MILIFGQTLIQLTGILVGLFFIFTFFGCCCHINSRFSRRKFFELIRKNHKIFIYLTLIFFLIHASLAILARYLSILI